MARKIFTVNAEIVNGNGQRGTVTGFPKRFDSADYNADVKKAEKRAKGSAYGAFSEMCAVDDRQLQHVQVLAEDGFVVLNLVDGELTTDGVVPQGE